MRSFFKSKWFWAVVVLLVLAALLYSFFLRKNSVVYSFVSVSQGSITETVSVTGNTTPINSVSLGFQNSGIVSNVYYALGQEVPMGATIASLNTTQLSAALKQAQANVDGETATLNGLLAGAQPEDIAASQAALTKAEQDLSNMYASIIDTSTQSYSSANDAVRIELNPMFSNAETSQPQLTFETTGSQASINATSLRQASSGVLNSWQTELSSLSATSGTISTTTLASFLKNEVYYLSVIQNLLNTTSSALSGSINVATAQIASYQANVNTGLNEVNAAVSNLNTISQNIASQNSTVAELQAELALKQAGSTSQSIQAQQAVVEQAKAAVASAEANLANADIVAPISGVITEQDAKVGEIATPGTPLVSIISNGQFEVDTQVPETDIGKIAIGDTVSMTFDAFQGQTFTGKVFYIDPAETINQGVVDYLVKVSFDAPYSDMKSGLTANLNIKTKEDTKALILPQYAVLQNDQGIFVETLLPDGKTATTTPVTLGIQDESGNVEILSGVTVGEKVVNIGLKK